MPQGKGTYGSQVGRPPKKLKKYQVGGEIEELEAAQMGQELESIPLESVEPEFPIEEEQGFPTTNAPDRSESYQLGGMIEPPTTPSITPTPQYKKGGPVDVTDVVKKVAKKVAQEKRHDKWIAEADKKKETIKSGAEVYPMSDKLKYQKKGHKRVKEEQINKMAKSIRKQKKKKK